MEEIRDETGRGFQIRGKDRRWSKEGEHRRFKNRNGVDGEELYSIVLNCIPLQSQLSAIDEETLRINGRGAFEEWASIKV